MKRQTTFLTRAALISLLLLFLIPAAQAQKIYWSTYGPKLVRANLDGSAPEEFELEGGPFENRPFHMEIDPHEGKIYWTSPGNDDRIQRANLDGSGIETLVSTDLRTPWGIALDLVGGKMYWTDKGADEIKRADLDGSNVETIVPIGGFGMQGIALDVPGGKMYWTDKGEDGKGVGIRKILRANLDGSDIEPLVTIGTGFSPDSAEDIKLDLEAGKMYWTRFFNGQPFSSSIQRANLDGSNVEDVVTTDIFSPQFLALDVPGGKMYWTDTEGITIETDFGRIVRANLDGSEKEDIVSGLDEDPRGLAIGPEVIPSSVGNWNVYR